MMFRQLRSCFTALIIVIAGVGATGCGAPQVAGHVVIDCISGDRAKIDATIADLGTKTKPDGSRDWSAIEADAIASGIEIGGCALAEFVEAYLAPAKSVKAPSDSLEARQALEHVRATQAGGPSFKTRLGTL
jgi:hypothetical protein